MYLIIVAWAIAVALTTVPTKYRGSVHIAGKTSQDMTFHWIIMYYYKNISTFFFTFKWNPFLNQVTLFQKKYMHITAHMHTHSLTHTSITTECCMENLNDHSVQTHPAVFIWHHRSRASLADFFSLLSSVSTLMSWICKVTGQFWQ